MKKTLIAIRTQESWICRTVNCDRSMVQLFTGNSSQSYGASHAISQCYTDTGERAPSQVQAATRYAGGMEGWVDLSVVLYTEMAYLSASKTLYRNPQLGVEPKILQSQVQSSITKLPCDLNCHQFPSF